MAEAIRKMLWRAFAALLLLILSSLIANLLILDAESRHERRIVEASAPMLEAIRKMDSDLTTIVSASRGYVLTGESQYLQQYADAITDFEKSTSVALQLKRSGRDEQLISALRRHFGDVHSVTDQQIELFREGKARNAIEFMQEATRIRRGTPDYAGLIAQQHQLDLRANADRMANYRRWLMIFMTIGSLLLIAAAAFAASRIETSMTRSMAGQVRRTEMVIAGMADGVMLLDEEGRSVYVNPAGEKLLGRNDTGVTIDQHPSVYGFRDAEGKPLDARELPAAQAIATGRAVEDVTTLIAREDRVVAVSMNATPLREEGRTTGAIVTFRDITEHRKLQEQMEVQAERAQILADAGAFFSSNIDPVWVTQAIAERVAEVLGDWAAVILKSDESNELRVASIYHRDLASLGLAWSYIYRQPLTVGEGIIGQVVATGYPSMTMNVGGANGDDTGFRVGTSQTSNPVKFVSLLVLPLRSRRQMLGALVIAAHEPDRAMTDEKLPLAEVMAERAAVAIDNAKLYTEQVDARRKVEDLSRLKDEFLSIASHELRTPVTSIKGYTQLAKALMREEDVATAGEYLDIALDQIDRMSRLILELLDVSRIETGRLEIRHEPIDWEPFVRDVVNRLRTAVSNRRFHLELPAARKMLHGDRDRLEQVLGNLLENAVKYSPDGSDVFVRVEDRGDQVITTVTDRGIGIPPDELGQVFERFHRGRQVSSTNYGGLGLGLYIAKQIVERHEGSIWVESREGSGTTFSFSLPVEQLPEAAANRPSEKSETESAAHA